MAVIELTSHFLYYMGLNCTPASIAVVMELAHPLWILTLVCLVLAPPPTTTQHGAAQCNATQHNTQHTTLHHDTPHLLCSLQLVVDQVGLPMWLSGHSSGTTPILMLRPPLPQAQASPAAHPPGGDHA